MKAETVEVDEALFEVLSAFSAAAAEVKAPWLVIGETGEFHRDTHSTRSGNEGHIRGI